MPNRVLRIGYVPLTDAAPLLVAEALELFGQHGVQVALSEESAWAAVRDRLAHGLLDGAHLLAPMPIAISSTRRLAPVAWRVSSDRPRRPDAPATEEGP